MQKYKAVIIFIVVSVLLAVLVSPFASSSPDGLEWVAEIKGFIHRAEEYVFWKLSIMPDYSVSFIKSEAISTSIAGFFGTLFCFVTTIVLFKLFGKRANEDKTN